MARHPIRTATGLSLLLALGACDSSKVSWEFESRTIGESGSSGAWIRVTYGRGGGDLRLTGDGQRVLTLSGSGEDNRPLTAHVAVRTDLALLLHEGEVEIRSPALPHTVTIPGGDLILQGGAVLARVDVPEGMEPLPGLPGPGSFHCFAEGNLILFENPTCLFVFQEGDQPERFDPAVVRWSLAGGTLRLEGEGGSRLLAPPPPVSHDRRMLYVEGTNTVRLLGPRGEVTAELPAGKVEMSDGADGLRLMARLLAGPRGAPVVVLLPLRNRHLVVVEGG